MLWLITLAAVLLAGGYRAWRAMRAPSAPGAGRLIGRRAVVRKASGHTGWVLLDGAWWKVCSRTQVLQPGQTVQVVALHGLELLVRPEELAVNGA